MSEKTKNLFDGCNMTTLGHSDVPALQSPLPIPYLAQTILHNNTQLLLVLTLLGMHAYAYCITPNLSLSAQSC